MTLGLTQPLTEMSTRNILGMKGDRPVLKADNFAICVCVDCLDDVGASTSHNPIGLHGLLQGSLYFISSSSYRVYSVE
jgi:hypothetical protein